MKKSLFDLMCYEEDCNNRLVRTASTIEVYRSKLNHCCENWEPSEYRNRVIAQYNSLIAFELETLEEEKRELEDVHNAIRTYRKGSKQQ